MSRYDDQYDAEYDRPNDRPMNFQHNPRFVSKPETADIANPAPSDFVYTSGKTTGALTAKEHLLAARKLLNEAQRVPGFGRGRSLCLTKVQEAIFWLDQDNSYVVGT